MCCQGIQERAENTVLRVTDVAAHSNHLLEKKSRFQLHCNLFKPRAQSFTYSLEGTMGLNTEL